MPRYFGSPFLCHDAGYWWLSIRVVRDWRWCGAWDHSDDYFGCYHDIVYFEELHFDRHYDLWAEQASYFQKILRQCLAVFTKFRPPRAQESQESCTVRDPFIIDVQHLCTHYFY